METYYAGFIPCEGSVSVIFPDVPGCATWGETMEHAFAMAVDALAGHLEVLADDNDPIPQPSTYEVAWEKLRAESAALDFGPLPEGTVVHPVPAPDLDMRTKQVSVSFSKYKLDMIDRKAKAAGMTRSGFLAAAASVYEGQV
ncbi:MULTISPECIES: type II toxin-antitoxin system HicB family antitoxin [unclassified Desulfovibrio]|uniref:type II toxin-antitoxin system HicB family antitoxin n=1 Tax=unclassified Desulfovibrio TaxID=2593640 RepID=UPI000F5FC660|nr:MULTISPECIES: type II toxin-antitoxin system HicB family antitoxin [unclassified Desulfovibrio]RRD69355.1 HicB family protein [Desulfovibrio sp. OH1209_COT-279]RRD86062.1 HicB family protein [Desulfovibrio sp. OH1186_COT-070]